MTRLPAAVAQGVLYNNKDSLSSRISTDIFTCIVLFISFLQARRYASAGNSDRNVSVRPSVRLSVCHAPVLCQNEES